VGSLTLSSNTSVYCRKESPAPTPTPPTPRSSVTPDAPSPANLTAAAAAAAAGAIPQIPLGFNLPNLPFPLGLPNLPNLPLPLSLPVGGLPQLPVPHDLTRFVSMLSGAAVAAGNMNNVHKSGETSKEESSGGSSRSSSAGVLTPNNMAQINSALSGNGHGGHHNRHQEHGHIPGTVGNNGGSTIMNRPAGSSSGGTAGLKRKKDDCEMYSNHPPRRSLRPRIERSYAESPDIVVEFEEEPVKVNGTVNGFDGDEDSDSDPGEMPPLPPMKVHFS